MYIKYLSSLKIKKESSTSNPEVLSSTIKIRKEEKMNKINNCREPNRACHKRKKSVIYNLIPDETSNGLMTGS